MKEKEGILITDVVEDSIAEELDIQKGDRLISINGSSISDVIEYKFIIATEYLELEVQKIDGEYWLYEIDKEYDEDLGLIFESSLMDKPKACKNKCIFCFIDQLPRNLRKTLYFKDDDVRLSFLQGNYVTFTNTTEEDIQRIISYRISPINISVHATDEKTRKFMLNNPAAGNINSIIDRLTKAGIKINCQVVLCPTINDGEILDKTIDDLSKYWPNVLSIAVVPVAVTKHRDKLYSLITYNEDRAKETVDQIKNWQNKLLKALGTRFVFLADEFYIMSKQPMPSYEEYEDSHQLEDGIGMTAKFEHEFYKELRRLAAKNISQVRKEVSVVTGKLAYNNMKKYCDDIEKEFSNIKIFLYGIKNSLLGDTVTVSGLIPGQDIIEQLKGKELGDKILLPTNLVRAEDVVLIDDISLKDIEDSLQCKTVKVEISGEAFVREILL